MFSIVSKERGIEFLAFVVFIDICKIINELNIFTGKH